MTHKQLKDKVMSMIRDDKKFMESLIDKAIKSGCMDIEGAENNFILPKQLLTAIYKEMQHQRKPLSGDKKFIKNVENIYNNL